jgi:proline racemase
VRFDRVISTIDAHAAGEPLRIVTAGVPPLPGATVLDRRRRLMERHDDLRRVLLFEPRGHADMYGAVLTPPVSPDADYGVIFLTNEGYSTMCGHGVVALTVALIETGAFPAADGETTVGYDTPAGLVIARADVRDGRVLRVAFRNVPAFVMHRAVPIEVEGLRLEVDVAWGGASYALVEAAAFGLDIVPANARRLTDLGMAVKRAVVDRVAVVHPDEPELRGLYGTILTGPPADPAHGGRNVTVYADGAVDRSPCGTGTSARLAWLHAAGALGVGRPWVHESIIGTTFTGTILEATAVAGVPAVVTEIAGRGFVTGLHQFLVDRDDPTADGFLVR